MQLSFNFLMGQEVTSIYWRMSIHISLDYVFPNKNMLPNYWSTPLLGNPYYWLCSVRKEGNGKNNITELSSLSFHSIIPFYTVYPWNSVSTPILQFQLACINFKNFQTLQILDKAAVRNLTVWKFWFRKICLELANLISAFFL